MLYTIRFHEQSSVRVKSYPAWEDSNRFETSVKIINVLQHLACRLSTDEKLKRLTIQGSFVASVINPQEKCCMSLVKVMKSRIGSLHFLRLKPVFTLVLLIGFPDLNFSTFLSQIATNYSHPDKTIVAQLPSEEETNKEIDRLQVLGCAMLAKGYSIRQVISKLQPDVEKMSPVFIYQYITYLRGKYGESGFDVFEIVSRRMLGGAIRGYCPQYSNKLKEFYQNFQI